MTETVTPTSSAPDPREAIRAKYGAVAGSSFDTAPPPVAFSISCEGLEGTGKTKFALSGPRPLVIVNFGDRDPNILLYAMSPEERRGVTIYNLQPTTPEGWTFQEAVKSLTALTEIITVEAPRMPGGTFVLDGGSSWWSAMQRVFVEPKEKERLAKGLKSTGGIIYAEANDRVRGILGYVKGLGCFLMITHQMSQDWDASGPIAGSYSPKRNSQIAGIVEVVLRFEKFCVVCGAPQCQNKDHVGRVHKTRIIKFAGNTALEGLWIDNADFAKIYSLYASKPFVQQAFEA